MRFKYCIYFKKRLVVAFSLRKEAQTKMSDERKNKHLTLDDRIEIQECLNKSMTFKAIAKRIGKSPTTVSREVKSHLQIHNNGFVKSNEICPLLLKAPFVCNGCDKRSRSSCIYQRQLYYAKKAQADYEALLSEAREGIPLNKESFYQTEQIISTAVKKGQHIYHSIKTNDLPVSTATVYRHIAKGYYTISPIDLPRAVKFKFRHKRNTEYVPYSVRVGRTYADYRDYIENNPNLPVSQLDTVIGKIGGKVIMTFHIISCDFMFGLLLDNKTAAEAADKVKMLKAELSKKNISFGNIFPILLTDNGGEFSIASAFENDCNNIRETLLFYCEPNSPYEKPHIEKNHTLFRDIVPSGSSFDDFTQEVVNLIFSHVNAVKRKQFNGKSAYDMFAFSYSPDLAKALGISFIPADEVIQSPKLLKSFSK